jgi:hypothetical protein
LWNLSKEGKRIEITDLKSTPTMQYIKGKSISNRGASILSSEPAPFSTGGITETDWKRWNYQITMCLPVIYSLFFLKIQYSLYFPAKAIAITSS